MFERLEQIEARFQDLGQQMADPEVLAITRNIRRLRSSIASWSRWWTSFVSTAR